MLLGKRARLGVEPAFLDLEGVGRDVDQVEEVGQPVLLPAPRARGRARARDHDAALWLPGRSDGFDVLDVRDVEVAAQYEIDADHPGERKRARVTMQSRVCNAVGDEVATLEARFALKQFIS